MDFYVTDFYVRDFYVRSFYVRDFHVVDFYVRNFLENFYGRLVKGKNRSSRPEFFFKKCVLKNFTKLIGVFL